MIPTAARNVAWTLVQDMWLGLQSKFIPERLETEVSTTISGTEVPATSISNSHIVASERVLIANVELSVRDNGMGPGRTTLAFDLEAAFLDVGLRRCIDEGDFVSFAEAIEHSVGENDGAFAHAAVLPGDFAGHEIEAH